MSTFHILALVNLLFISLLQAYKPNVSEYCLFEESLKNRIRNLECDYDLDDCATRIRLLVQEYYTGAWGVALIPNKQDIINQRIEWYINPVVPKPSRCRMVVDEDILIEIFRTGYREKDVKNDQRHWIWKQAKTLNFEGEKLDLCPHSALRQIISLFSIKAHKEMADTRYRHGLNSLLHSAAKSLAQVFENELHIFGMFLLPKMILILP